LRAELAAIKRQQMSSQPFAHAYPANLPPQDKAQYKAWRSPTNPLTGLDLVPAANTGFHQGRCSTGVLHPFVISQLVLVQPQVEPGDEPSLSHIGKTLKM